MRLFTFLYIPKDGGPRWRGFVIRAIFSLPYYRLLSLLCIGTDCKSAPAGDFLLARHRQSLCRTNHDYYTTLNLRLVYAMPELGRYAKQNLFSIIINCPITLFYIFKIQFVNFCVDIFTQNLFPSIFINRVFRNNK